jgi:two-component system, chemotaxis family, chemotaxis protein CheY
MRTETALDGPRDWTHTIHLRLPAGRSSGLNQNDRDYPHPMPRVLTIDDDALIRTIVRGVVGAAGIITDEAVNGAEGVAKARATPPDLILCDLDMHGMDGVRTLAELRADAVLRQVPLIVITGAATPDDEHRLLRDGVVAVLRKPFAFAVLLHLVRKHLAPRPKSS